MANTIILAIKYAEPEWQQTLACLLKQKEPVIFIDRNGTGSLAEAINRGIKSISGDYDYVWIVTNILFFPDTLHKLQENMKANNCDAIHPAFASDHAHLRINNIVRITKRVPFLEFTAPLIKLSLLKNFLLDEDMPYWGHDLDWGYRVSLHNYTLAVDNTAPISHTYIRNNNFNHDITLIRKKLRKATDDNTRAALVKKYGANWSNLLKYPNDNK